MRLHVICLIPRVWIQAMRPHPLPCHRRKDPSVASERRPTSRLGPLGKAKGSWLSIFLCILHITFSRSVFHRSNSPISPIFSKVLALEKGLYAEVYKMKPPPPGQGAAKQPGGYIQWLDGLDSMILVASFQCVFFEKGTKGFRRVSFESMVM